MAWVPFAWMAGGSAAASIVGQHTANQTNREISNANNAMSMELARTAHQLEVKDLEAAGLSPMISYRGQGASVPSLQSPHVGNVAEGVDKAVNTGTAAYTQSIQRKAVEADILLKQATTAETMARTKNIETDSRLKRVQMIGGLASAGQARASEQNLMATLPKIEAEIANIAAQTKLHGKEFELKDIDVGIRELDLWERQQLAPKIIEMMKIELDKLNMTMPGAENRMTAQQSGFARLLAMLGFAPAETTDIMGKVTAAMAWRNK